MSAIHDRFDAWLAADGAAELARDVALHASGCDRCLGRAAAIDGLLRLDVGVVAAPPVLDATRSTLIDTRPVAAGRIGAWVVAIGVLTVVTLIGVANLGPARTGQTTVETSPTPINEGVLGGAAGPSTTRTPSASDSPSATPTSAESAPAASIVVPIATAPATAAPTPEPTPVPPTTAPSDTPQPTGTPAPTRSPSPTPSPTIPQPPTPTPTPEPTPTPVPNCEDGIDNDDDLLIDAADPGCTLANDEFAA